MPGLFMVEQVVKIAQIVAIANRQHSQPPPPPREVLEPRRSIERAQKMGAKDSKIYKVMVGHSKQGL